MYSVLEKTTTYQGTPSKDEDITWNKDQTDTLDEAFNIRNRFVLHACLASREQVKVINDDIHFMGITIITPTKTTCFWLHKD